MVTINLTSEIDKTIKYYNQRITACKSVIESIPAKIETEKQANDAKRAEIREMKNPQLKAFLKQQQANEVFKGTLTGNRTMLLDKALGTIKDKAGNNLNDHIYRMNAYTEQVKFLKEIQEKGIPAKFEPMLKIPQDQFVPAFDYKQLPSTWGYTPAMAKDLEETLNKHKNEICLLTGGGKFASDPDDLYYITKAFVRANPMQVTPGQTAQVGVSGYKFEMGLTHEWDFCGKMPKTKPRFDFQNETGTDQYGEKGYGIDSWQINCLKK